jgi:hypothetical protein
VRQRSGRDRDVKRGRSLDGDPRLRAVLEEQLDALRRAVEERDVQGGAPVAVGLVHIHVVVVVVFLLLL